jgi:hypothetical protein
MVGGNGQVVRKMQKLSFMRYRSHNEIFSHRRMRGSEAKMPFLAKKQHSIIWHGFAPYIF